MQLKEKNNVKLNVSKSDSINRHANLFFFSPHLELVPKF